MLKGHQDFNTGVWRINLHHEKPKHTISVANNVYELRSTSALDHYLHKAMFSPTKYAPANLPGLTEQAMNKHLKIMPEPAIGHMHHNRHNIHSTSKDSNTSDFEDETVPTAVLVSKTQLVYAMVSDQVQLYIDLAGRFPVRYSKGNWYVRI
jgi:hypothetical protein